MQQAAALLWLLAGAGVDTLRYSHSRARQLFSLSGEDSGYTADTRSYFYHAVSSYCTVQHNFDSHSKIFEYLNIFSQIVEQNYEQKWRKADTQMAEMVNATGRFELFSMLTPVLRCTSMRFWSRYTAYSQPSSVTIQIKMKLNSGKKLGRAIRKP